MISLRIRPFDFIEWTLTTIEGPDEDAILSLLAADFSRLDWEVEYSRDGEEWLELGDEDASAT